jgi:hypothetical protein
VWEGILAPTSAEALAPAWGLCRCSAGLRRKGRCPCDWRVVPGGLKMMSPEQHDGKTRSVLSVTTNANLDVGEARDTDTAVSVPRRMVAVI